MKQPENVIVSVHFSTPLSVDDKRPNRTTLYNHSSISFQINNIINEVINRLDIENDFRVYSLPRYTVIEANQEDMLDHMHFIESAVRLSILLRDTVDHWNNNVPEPYHIMIKAIVVDYGNSAFFNKTAQIASGEMIDRAIKIADKLSSNYVCFTESINSMIDIASIFDSEIKFESRANFYRIRSGTGTTGDDLFYPESEHVLFKRMFGDDKLITKSLKKKSNQITILYYSIKNPTESSVTLTRSIMNNVMSKKNGYEKNGFYCFENDSEAIACAISFRELVEASNAKKKTNIHINAIAVDVSLVFEDDNFLYGDAVTNTFVIGSTDCNNRIVVTADLQHDIEIYNYKEEQMEGVSVPCISLLIDESDSSTEVLIDLDSTSTEDLLIEINKKKKKSTKNWKESDLQVIVVSDEKSSFSSMESEELTILDILPDEIYVNLFKYLGTEDMGRCGRVNSRFNDISDKPEIWQHRYDTWNVSRYQQTQTKNKEFYVVKYREHLLREEARIENEKKEAIRRKRDAKKHKIDSCLKICFFNRFSIDYLSCLCIILWSLFLALRLDEIILWSWHLVNIPMYVMSFQWVVGVFSLDVVIFIYGDSMKDSTRKVRKGYTIFRIFSEENFFRALYYCNVPCIAIFFVLLAEYQDKHNFPAYFIGMPFALTFLSWIITIFSGCGSIKPSADFCARLFLFFPSLCVVWLVGFPFMRAIGLVSWSWYVIMLPHWILLAVLFFIDFVGSIFLCCEGGNEKKFCYIVFSMLMFGLVPYFIWMLLVCANLESFDLTGVYAIPWVVTFIPLFVVEVSLTVMLLIFMEIMLEDL